jgi:hypothetical protein
MRMKQLDLTNMITVILAQGFTVCYLDDDVDRRKALEFIKDPNLEIRTGRLTGKANKHYNVVIAVNDAFFHPDFKKDYPFLSASFGGHEGCIIRVSL